MQIEFSNHALSRMNDRNIEKENVFSVVKLPDFIFEHDKEIRIYTKLVVEGSKRYLYRVFVNCAKKPALIITVYKTSKFGKYGYKI